MNTEIFSEDIIQGRIFNIQSFSTHDGPGIRTTVFMSGCSLRCKWCHNPEGLRNKPQLQFDSKKCISCKACAEVCPETCHSFEHHTHHIDFVKCTLCETCIEICPAHALQVSNHLYSPEQLSSICFRDLHFYKSKGGVTFSGGEPLLQAPFIAKTAILLKQGGIPTLTIDTAGNVPWKCFELVLPYIDYFLFDIKAATPKIHQCGTGVDNTLIQENLKKLDQYNKTIFIRIPIIGGLNDTESEMNKIHKITSSLRSVAEVRLIPYHTFGREKYQTLGYEQPDTFYTTEEKVAKLQHIFKNQPLKAF